MSSFYLDSVFPLNFNQMVLVLCAPDSRFFFFVDDSMAYNNFSFCPITGHALVKHVTVTKGIHAVGSR